MYPVFHNFFLLLTLFLNVYLQLRRSVSISSNVMVLYLFPYDQIFIEWFLLTKSN